MKSNLRLSKAVTGGNASDADRDALYPFRLLALSGTGGGSGGSGGAGGAGAGGQYAAFTTDPSQAASGVFLVSGVTPDRISVYQAEAEQSVIWLKSGESALIEKLPAGNYQLEEWISPAVDANRYRSSYVVVNDADSTVLDAADGHIAAVSLDVDDLSGSFTNDFGPIAPRPNTSLPATSDNSTMLIILFVSMLTTAAALFALHI